MKVVEIISDTNIGGAGIVLLTRISEDPIMSSRTVVAVPKGSALKKRFDEKGIKVMETDVCGDRSFQLSAIIKYRQLLKKLSPDIVNCHGCLSGRIAAFLCRIPLRLYTRHCAFPLKKWQKNFVYKFLVGFFQKLLSHHVIAVANAAKENLIDVGIPEKRISVIINGVTGFKKLSEQERKKQRDEWNIPQDAVVVGIFARLEKCKGHIDLLKAASVILKKSKNYRFLIIGTGSEENRLKTVCRQLNIEEYVIFTGFAEDVSALFNITNINVNCSIGTETSSLALSEGMSLGVPCVASDFGGNTYMVKNGYNGFTYPVGDHEALAKRIILISQNKELYKKLSSNAFERFKNELNSKEMSRQTYALYEELICRHKN